MTTAARQARAAADELLAILGIAVVGLVIVDVTFAVNDIVLGANGELPSRGYAAAETILGAPQALAFNPALVLFAGALKNDPLFPLLVIPTTGVTALTTHGIWRLADDDVNPSALPALSSAVGADAKLTLNAPSSPRGTASSWAARRASRR